jgi:predicted metal-dependent peptidase
MHVLQLAIWLAGRAAPYARLAIASARHVIEPRVPIAASDEGWRVYWNPDTLRRPPAEVAWILLHEVLGHLVRGHARQTRLAAAEPRRANVAQDLEIESWELPGLVRPADGVWPARYNLPAGKIWPWYYDQLPASVDCDCGSASDGVPRPYERAVDDSDVPAVIEPLRDAVARVTAEAVAAHPGNVPVGLRVWADAVLAPPRVPWRTVLRRWAATTCSQRGRGDVAGARERRRMMLPRLRAARPRVAIIVDTSGSMSALGGRVLGEVVGACRAGAEVDVAWCDVEVVWQRHVTCVTALRPQGGGGTDLRPAIAEAMAGRYDGIVIVTDCATPWPPVAPHNVFVVAMGDATIPAGWPGVNITE